MPFYRLGHGVFLVISPTYCLSAPAAGTVFARLTPKFRPLAVEFNGQIRKTTPFSFDSAIYTRVPKGSPLSPASKAGDTLTPSAARHSSKCRHRTPGPPSRSHTSTLYSTRPLVGAPLLIELRPDSLVRRPSASPGSARGPGPGIRPDLSSSEKLEK